MSVPADVLPRAAPLSPGQAAVGTPHLSVPLPCQLKGAFFAGRRLAWDRTWQRTGTWMLGRARRIPGICWTRRRARAGLRPTGRRRWRWRKRAGLQHLLQLAFQQHLVLRHHIQQGSHTLVHRQHILRGGARLCPRQDTQNILQLFALGINNMAQGKLFHSDGSDDHCQGFFPRQVCPVWWKRRHRHMKYSIVPSGLRPGWGCVAGNALPPFYLMWLKPSCDAGT